MWPPPGFLSHLPFHKSGKPVSIAWWLRVPLTSSQLEMCRHPSLNVNITEKCTFKPEMAPQGQLDTGLGFWYFLFHRVACIWGNALSRCWARESQQLRCRLKSASKAWHSKKVLLLLPGRLGEAAKGGTNNEQLCVQWSGNWAASQYFSLSSLPCFAMSPINFTRGIVLLGRNTDGPLILFTLKDKALNQYFVWWKTYTTKKFQEFLVLALNWCY